MSFYAGLVLFISLGLGAVLTLPDTQGWRGVRFVEFRVGSSDFRVYSFFMEKTSEDEIENSNRNSIRNALSEKVTVSCIEVIFGEKVYYLTPASSRFMVKGSVEVCRDQDEA